MSNNTEWNKMFWTEDAPTDIPLKGGMFYRSMGMGKFIKEAEEKGYRIYGVRFDDSNNCEFIFEEPTDE